MSFVSAAFFLRAEEVSGNAGVVGLRRFKSIGSLQQDVA